jgi:hypothetical protein
MLRLPGEGEETLPLVVKEAQRQRRSHQGHGHGRRSGRGFDETFADKPESSPMLVRVLVASAATVFAVVLAGLLWPRGDTPEGAPPPRVVADAPDPGPAADPAEARVLTVAAINEELEPVVRAFLEAPDLETAARWTARSQRTLERMRSHFADGYRPPGYKAVQWNSPLTRGEGWASFELETGDFQTGRIYLVEDDGWKVDWESWAGWSPLSWDELKAKRPTAPMRIRALVRADNYFNFGFSDDSEWASFALAPPGDGPLLYGYVPRFGPLRSLLPVEEEKPQKLLLDIRFEADVLEGGNQVVIEEVIGEGWLDTTDLP